MRTQGVSVGFALVVVLGLTAPSTGAVLVPATFNEYVGISGYTIQGASLEVPESVNLTVTQGQTGNLGSGTGVATASGVLPLVTELDLSLSGGTNSSVIGGTAVVETVYQFSLEPDAGGLPANVPIFLTASGWVTVDTSLPDGFAQGVTMARIMYPGGQVQADNEDAQGGHEGYFSFDLTVGPLNLAAGTAQKITIYLSSHGQALGLGPDFFYHGHAFVDPVIEIDPNFAFKDHFQVVFSQGIIVPEPTTLGLLALGGLALVRRRRTA
jgi:hypothetical protein